MPTSPSATQHCCSRMEAASSKGRPTRLWVRNRTDMKEGLWLQRMVCQLCLVLQLKRGDAALKGTEAAFLTPEHLMTQFRQHGMNYIQMSVQRLHNRTQQLPRAPLGQTFSGEEHSQEGSGTAEGHALDSQNKFLSLPPNTPTRRYCCATR